ncbi:response regulator transcription factor [Shewanella sp. SR43-4]|jgi:two-component system response regulator QseB|uniref:Response regulator transcription factor n=1 Tax=Shewanella vesiculosa TaxID=518738 RepID=A0ABV0FLZ5_9GAMM|nr:MULTISPECIES: response regulator transcription factor [Shewanella]NCQ45569.1 response regulator transcription factor [Shewanella frigidimarina]MBB1318126.1 response regulator transcription factor [Shewanella sp. SR43-4]MBB1320217.1 response regulator transcription factor [Shewanella sp. SR43-8]MBB1389715.1 response regulator transcription factor [Shewanella sp. SG44-6]MBB1474666.1 response regulator transcription factor [Shewanella sp. SG41-3]|tara:strand:+ start:8075 stop:8734 length:660 start_codon:yes stop_codon:yes gene_type:complete
MRVLLVEDNKLLAQGVMLSLAKEGIQVDHLPSYKQAEVALNNEDFSAIILDLGLPDGNGADLLKLWRRNGISLPIIVLTANTDFDTRLMCLDIGADDYLSKPFDVRELIARLRAIIRRQHGLDNNQFSYGALNIDFARCEVHFRGVLVSLSRREYQLLLEFAQSAGRVLTRNQLEQLTYGWDEVGSNSIEVHIHHLRKKTATELIKTVRGIGYILTETV